jgi:hypothetical protein
MHNTLVVLCIIFSVMNEETVETFMYPASPTSFPIVWRPYIHDMIPPRFAVWYPDRETYQVFDIIRQPNYSIIVKPIRTERANSFYFAVQNAGDRQSRTITLYKPRASKHTHVDVGIWFTGAWLCKRSEHRLRATIPIMGVSDPGEFPFKGNVGLYGNQIFTNWYDNYTTDYIRGMIHNRKVYTSLHIIEEPVAPMCEIPRFAAEVLIQDAVNRNEICPITMEPISCDNSVLTSCFHIFEKSAIQTWLSKHPKCPVCKNHCTITKL